jgi:hypothetical protein
MFLQINEPDLLERQFEKVYMKARNGKYSTFYYKQGLYLEFFYHGYYDVYSNNDLYSNEMDLIATVNNFYRLEMLMIAKTYPVGIN